ncbi:MAG: hypothetical protein HN712_18635 [Gemmatimonadetes bacterium]|jgi:flagellar motor switch protein FliN|nr:hypothetical protein [Gemmatimonadota bacterium]MBT7862343.1 hypothetical protein [Gemmatimonadota bacterium]
MATKKAVRPKKAAKKTAQKKAAPVVTASTPSPQTVRQPTDNIDAIGKVQLTLTAELGRTRETIGKVREYGDQSLIELDRTVGEPVDILLNGELFARGEVVTVNENFGVRITEVISRPGG